MDIGIVLDDNTKLGMVAIIRTNIVLKGVNGTVSHSTNGPPEQIAEVDNQIGRHAIGLLINLFWPENLRTNIDTLRINQRLELRLELILQCFHFARLDNALRFSPLNVEEDTRIIAAITPDLRLAPSDATLLNRC